MKFWYLAVYPDDRAVPPGVPEARGVFAGTAATPDDLLRKIREVLDETPGDH